MGKYGCKGVYVLLKTMLFKMCSIIVRSALKLFSLLQQFVRVSSPKIENYPIIYSPAHDFLLSAEQNQSYILKKMSRLFPDL